MASVVIKGNSSGSGSVTLESPNTNSTPTFILPSADGTNGQVLTTNGSGNLSFTTPAAGAFEFITSTDLSNNATADFTLPSGYDAYQVIFANVIPATDLATFGLRTSSNGGSSFDAGASDYVYRQWGSQGTAAAQISFGNQEIGTAAGEDGVSGSVIVYLPSLAKVTFVNYITIGEDGNGLFWPQGGGGCRNSTTAVDAIRFLFSSGNMESGTITLYGMKNS